jgi:lysophospholipase L1-like esterase
VRISVIEPRGYHARSSMRRKNPNYGETKMKNWIAASAACLLAIVSQAPKANAQATDTKLQSTDLVAICGDSITEQKIYSVDIEDYLIMCRPVPGLRAEQFGWGGETSWGFLSKMSVFTLPFKPTVATTCYGMNDGGYGPMTDAKAKQYRDAETGIIKAFKKAGVHFIVLGSSGAVDSETFHKSPEQAVMYNKTLAALRDIGKDVAAKEGVTFADVNSLMADVMVKIKAKYGKDYAFAGGDGVHPSASGHLVMAYAFLKAMGFDGEIGTITVDLAGNKAEATDGHKIVSINGGTVQVESSRYPFCFAGDPANPSATTGVINFFPFNDDLNRFRLIVNNPGADKLKVTWGDASKEFSAADLAKGINLAAEFLNNPFSQPFAAVQEKIRTKQNSETTLIKNLYFAVPQLENNLPNTKDAYEKLADAVPGIIDMQASGIRDVVAPVKHTIKIEAVK